MKKIERFFAWIKQYNIQTKICEMYQFFKYFSQDYNIFALNQAIIIKVQK